MNILFVCTANKLRSPTAAAIFADTDGINVHSAGLDPAAPQPVTDELVAWADRIYVMENHHRNKLRKKFRAALGSRPVITLGIPDEYEFMQPELIAILKRRLPIYVSDEEK